MKLRLDAHSLRLRLSEPELARFAESGHLAEELPLAPGPTGHLRYALQQTPDDSTAAGQTLRVAYTPGALTVLVPVALAQSWLSSDQVSLSATLATAAGPELRILVEKDLGCRH